MSIIPLRAHFTHVALWRALSAFVLPLSMFGIVGCSSASDASEEPAPIDRAATVSSRLLAPGTRETLVDGIASVENSLFTSTGRLLVTGDDGIYEIGKEASGPPRKTQVTASSGCKFSGITEAHGVLYAGCYDGTNSKVFAATLAPSPAFQSIYDLPGVTLANGVAADDAGHVYIADSTHGNILRLTVDTTNPLKVTQNQVFSSGNLFPNGLKFYGSALYFSDFVAVKRLPLLADGRAGAITTLTTQLTFFDDLYVDAQGIFVANYLGGAITFLTPNGFDLFDTAGLGLNGPSSVVPAKGRLGLSNKDLIVTEKGANRVSVFHPL
jgi:sugar lactone lactonase YvrE